MIRCTLCNQELPECEFYPSDLKRGLHHCKKCRYKHWGKKSIKKYTESIKELPNFDFNRHLGGYTVSIINYVKPNEHRYTIKGTDGVLVKTNDVKTFKIKLNEILDKLE